MTDQTLQDTAQNTTQDIKKLSRIEKFKLGNDPAHHALGHQSQTQTSQEQQSASTYKYNSFWDVLKQDLNKDLQEGETSWDIPEEVKTGKFPEGKTEFDYLRNVILQAYEVDGEDNNPQNIDDSFIRAYVLSSQQQGFDKDKWMQEQLSYYTMLNTPSNEFLKWYYKATQGKSEKNPEGYTDEDINAYLKNKSKIELDNEAKYLKEELSKQYLVNLKQAEEEINKKYQEGVTLLKSQRDKEVAEVLKRNEGEKNFFGIEFTDEEYNTFRKEFPKLVAIYEKPDGTYSHSLHDWLMNNDDNVYKIAALMWYGENRIKDYITRLKETIKQNVTNKFLTSPNTGKAGVGMPGVPDVSKFK